MLALLKKVLANKSGAILVFVLILFASVMVVVASLLAYTRQTFNSVMTQQLNAKAYYLTMGAADAVIAALIKDDSAQGRLLDKFIAMSDKEREEFGDDKSDPDYAELDYGADIGKCRIKLDLWKDDDGRWWISAFITTEIPDYRLNIGYSKETNPKYELYYEFRTLMTDLSVQGFDILTEDMAIDN